MSIHKHNTFPTRLAFALRGLAYALRTERSLQIQALVFMLLTAVFTLLICQHDDEGHGVHPH